ncbi:MAG TPA: HD domain-containing phosphohydrolase [Candidatus Eisenbacteria bacterium]|nr:HD domain-containing phosphohydrolase [Candidatus Eisenbacteria bacterium]
MKQLSLERLAPKDEFRFALRGVIDADGARALDRLLFQCQARDAREVHLDVESVSEISTLGVAVLERQARVYEQTERRIVVHGVGGGVREALVDSGALVYASNGNADATLTTTGGTTGAAGTAGAGGAVESANKSKSPSSSATSPSSASSAEPAAAPESGPSAAEHQALYLKLRRKIVEFRNLFEITQGLNLARDLDAVLNLFSLSVMGQFGVERLALFLVDPDQDGHLAPRQVRGFGQDHFRNLLLPIAAVESMVRTETFVELRATDADAPSASREATVGGTPEAGASEVSELLRRSGLQWGVALYIRHDLIGMLFLGGRGARRAFQEEEKDLLTILAHQAAVAIANARFHRQAEERNLGLVRGMMSLIESRDVYAKGSTERVVRFVTAMARVLQVPQEQVKGLIYGAVLRDIGMIAVSHLILKNPAHLSEEEWSLIKQHPARGAQILEEMNLPRDVVEVVANHHERWGGDGYPVGIKGQEIPIGARIVSLVDAYVAMTSERPYRRALPYEKSRQVISENWGTPFDPALVEVFLAVLEKMEKRSRPRLDAPAGENAEPGAAPERAELDPLGSGATIPAASSANSSDSEGGASGDRPTPIDPLSVETNQ